MHADDGKYWADNPGTCVVESSDQRTVGIKEDEAKQHPKGGYCESNACCEADWHPEFPVQTKVITAETDTRKAPRGGSSYALQPNPVHRRAVPQQFRFRGDNSLMPSEMRKIGSITLQPRHSPDRTRHSINGEQITAFVALEIATYEPDSGFYLLHVCADGRGTDTWHETLDDAFHQAAFEFGVTRGTNGNWKAFRRLMADVPHGVFNYFSPPILDCG